MNLAYRLVLLIALVGSMPAGAADTAPGVEYLNATHRLPQGVPFAEAVRVGSMLYLSGTIGILPGKMQLVTGGIKEQAVQVMENIKAVLTANQLGLKDLVRCTVLLADMGEWGSFNEVYKTYFTDHYPARTAFAVNGLLLGARVELECSAAYP